MSEEQKPDLSIDDPGFTEADIARDEARPNHWGALAEDRKSTRLNSSHSQQSRMPSSA